MTSSLLSTINNYVQTFRGINPTTIPDNFVPGADLRGKWVIVTGGNSGIGFEAAKSFATWGANLILACRDPSTYEQHPTDAVKACQELAKEQGHLSTVEWWQIDLSCLSSVEAFYQRWLETNHALDILCNNAGVPSTDPIRMTDDGFHYTHQINLLALVLITLSLLPSIAKSPEPRIICTVSAAHHMGQLDFEHFNGGPGLGTLAYSNNKLFFQMWIVEMQSRFLKHPEYLHLRFMGLILVWFYRAFGILRKIETGPRQNFLYNTVELRPGKVASLLLMRLPALGLDQIPRNRMSALLEDWVEGSISIEYGWPLLNPFVMIQRLG
ncbi:NAD(P)-binding protein [Penicillium malachiteum]|uniref:NAD(P)-binding protein n=1 Tax=Penicillium malachiteum TaxID=1324776 RepID=UPI00254859F1|nr:NAD(P)-binding protein [Penicillium malachiteum]KAJ5729020.1 NAD(P)-binding protein [Penicillium malachiteum]